LGGQVPASDKSLPAPRQTCTGFRRNWQRFPQTATVSPEAVQDLPNTSQDPLQTFLVSEKTFHLRTKPGSKSGEPVSACLARLVISRERATSGGVQPDRIRFPLGKVASDSYESRRTSYKSPADLPESCFDSYDSPDHSGKSSSGSPESRHDSCESDRARMNYLAIHANRSLIHVNRLLIDPTRDAMHKYRGALHTRRSAFHIRRGDVRAFFPGVFMSSAAFAIGLPFPVPQRM
jgi:hypothetical protein